MSSCLTSLKEVIKAEAHRLGFELVGVTTPFPPPHIDHYKNWLRAGLHGEMAYLATERARQRRADPRYILPECRSILVLGIRYPAAHAPARGHQDLLAAAGELAQRPSPNQAPGRVASYAWGGDYHVVLADRLPVLVDFIEGQVGHRVPNRWYTDTGPILERDLAQRAGLGWIGKNTCLINPRQGSYFLLAEALLGIDLDPDPPFLPDMCGTCTRCLKACPTQCILPDRTLDARRCISYLTIELKGSIPPDLRPQMGSWVFGCDVCQEVCPWNQRFAPPDGDPAFAPRRDLPAPDLTQELSLTPQQFNLRFKGSPVKRTKRRGYLRNAAVALGNLGELSAVPALAQALLKDPEPMVRSHAAWALGRIGDETARLALTEAARTETDAGVRSEINAALGGELFGQQGTK